MAEDVESVVGSGSGDATGGLVGQSGLGSSSSRRAFIAAGAAVGVAAWDASQLHRFGSAIAGAGTLGVITN